MEHQHSVCASTNCQFIILVHPVAFDVFDADQDGEISVADITNIRSHVFDKVATNIVRATSGQIIKQILATQPQAATDDVAEVSDAAEEANGDAAEASGAKEREPRISREQFENVRLMVRSGDLMRYYCTAPPLFFIYLLLFYDAVLLSDPVTL
jgi:hypothetical protein